MKPLHWLKAGQAFIWEDGGIYVVTDTQTQLIKGFDAVLCVNVATGCLVKFHLSTEVEHA